jgi:predicted DsbA family dithiol-disulfide isomerase
MVTVHLDPACGWCTVVGQWLRAVAPTTGRTVAWRPYSLLLRDGPGDDPMTAEIRRRGLRISGFSPP